MREILPGVHHWTAVHPRWGFDVSCYHLEPERATIDPLLPAEGVEWFAGHGPPREVLLTNRHHLRDAVRLREAYGCALRCHRDGLHEFAAGESVEGFAPGDWLAGGGVLVHEVGAICPDEAALEIPRVRALALADGAIRDDAEAPLRFVEDSLLGDDPEGVKAGLRAAYARLLGLDFDTLLLAHGPPVVGGGREALSAFAEGGEL